jgi:hypothetical protein
VPSKIDDAADWLEGFLRDGPQPSNTIKAAAEGNGFSRCALDQAKIALGIVPKRTGFRGDYVWKMPDEVTEFG